MHTRRVVPEMDAHAVGAYQAGQRVPPGTYRALEGGREIRLDQEDVLPATLEGRVAVYLRRPESWGERWKGADA